MGNARADAVSRDLTALIRHEYDVDLVELIRHPDIEKRNKRLWRLTGVILKRDFSEAVGRRRTATTGARFRWEIDEKRLARFVRSGSWHTKILAELVGRRPAESVVAFGLRLKTETNFGKAFAKTLCLYICNDPQIRKEINQALQHAGLSKFKAAATPAGIIAISSVGLATELASVIPLLTVASTACVAVVAIVLGTVGLKAFCDNRKTVASESAPPAKNSGFRKSKGR
jgi:hypothetical protein